MSEEEVLIDVAAIGEKYEDKGYFRRLGEMFLGLGKPHDTPEYKKARFELQRQAAPLIAFVSVILFVIVLGDRCLEGFGGLCLRHTGHFGYIAAVVAVGSVYGVVHSEQIAVACSPSAPSPVIG